MNTIVLMFYSKVRKAKSKVGRGLLNPATLAVLCFLMPSILLTETFDYGAIRAKLIARYQHTGLFGKPEVSFPSNQVLATAERVVALTLDACGGGYNSEVIDFLVRHKIPATLFVSGLWIDSNKKAFLDLAKNPLFEIENHGLQHRSVVMTRRSIYKVRGVTNIGELVDEIGLNAEKIRSLTGRLPSYFRSATGYYDSLSIAVCRDLGYRVLNGNSAAFDYDKNITAEDMVKNVLKTPRPSIIVFHMNHPGWSELEAISRLYDYFTSKGYRFVKVSEYGIK